MLASMAELAQVFEAAMLVCFGISWPTSILKTVRAKQVGGKSLAFLAMIFTGYVAGTVAKLLLAVEAGTWPQAVTLLYVLNGLMVAMDMCLYVHYSRNPGGKSGGLNRT